MRIVFTQRAWDDYLWFQETDRRLLKRINQLIQDASRTPFAGMGKPEPLKADLSGYWSRRINDEHRLVYTSSVTDLRPPQESSSRPSWKLRASRKVQSGKLFRDDT